MAAVAGSFVRQPRGQSLIVLVAGTADPLDPAEAVAGLERAAKRQGLSVTSPSAPVAVDSGGAPPPLFLGNLGPMTEAHLAVLAPPSTTDRVDLLLWTLPSREPASLRSLYVLSVCAWAFRPRHLRCLLPPENEDGERARAQLLSGLRRTGQDGAVEVLKRPARWGDAASETLLDQVLMSALAASISQ